MTTTASRLPAKPTRYLNNIFFSSKYPNWLIFLWIKDNSETSQEQESSDEECEVEFLQEIVTSKVGSAKPTSTSTTLKQIEIITLDATIVESPKPAKSKKKKEASNNVAKTASPPKPDQIAELRQLIFTVLSFDHNDHQVSIPKADQALNKIYSARDQLFEWKSSCLNNVKLTVVRVHFEAIESMLNTLIEEHNFQLAANANSKRNYDSVLYSLYSKYCTLSMLLLLINCILYPSH